MESHYGATFFDSSIYLLRPAPTPTTAIAITITTRTSIGGVHETILTPLYINGKPYGFGNLLYMEELFTDYVVNSGMYDKEEVKFKVVKRIKE
ncbi:hypothetical protein [Priestia endophytica]|uniref:hypothetical protein n=1 Tax=Priestia endophytica TaxID=135735 RepID=UPI00227E2D3C|nr:hypothetical protein [Priestia endophytica]MCY8235351.1 hypothetical protein [Priestia endophytica]